MSPIFQLFFTSAGEKKNRTVEHHVVRMTYRKAFLYRLFVRNLFFRMCTAQSPVPFQCCQLSVSFYGFQLHLLFISLHFVAIDLKVWIFCVAIRLLPHYHYTVAIVSVHIASIFCGNFFCLLHVVQNFVLHLHCSTLVQPSQECSELIFTFIYHQLTRFSLVLGRSSLQFTRVRTICQIECILYLSWIFPSLYRIALETYSFEIIFDKS